MNDTASIAAAPADDGRAGLAATPIDGSGDPTTPPLEWHVSAGLTPYPDALATMQQRVAAIRAGTAAEQVWLVEHPPLYTAGTSARPEELTDPARFPTFAAGRGGQWTYHGPGQRTAYVMLDLTRTHGSVPARDAGCYVHGLESWLIGAVARFGVRGERRPGRIGIWVADPATGAEAKIGAIGVRVTRWVSWHGVALNVAPDLSHFSGIVPCGIREHGVTSLAALGIPATMAEADAALREAWEAVFGAGAVAGSACGVADFHQTAK
jgi:lipoyl(octanoyl) transferase